VNAEHREQVRRHPPAAHALRGLAARAHREAPADGTPRRLPGRASNGAGPRDRGQTGVRPASPPVAMGAWNGGSPRARCDRRTAAAGEGAHPRW
jgi:hypothetical protein